MKSTVIHVVVMVVAVVVGTALAMSLHTKQLELQPERLVMTKAPVGGFQKFMADVEWMLFINYMGSQSTVDETNISDVISRLEKLMKLDPNLDKLYEDGVSSISVADPKTAVEFLKKACENDHLKNNAQIPFYTGFVMVQYMKPADLKGALDYFDLAVKRGGGQGQFAHYASYLYRIKARLLAEEKKIDERLALAEVLYAEWLKSQGAGEYTGSSEMMGGDLKDRLLRSLNDVKAKADDYTPTNEALARATKISENVFADSHLCMNCITPYNAGQAFCSSCGKDVKPYGLCIKQGCGNVVGDARFCSVCGTAQKK